MSDKNGFVPYVLIGIKSLNANEVRGVNSLLNQLSHSPRMADEARVADILGQPNFKLILLKDPESNEVIGMASLVVSRTLMRTTAFVEDVVVDKEYRGLKLGEYLIKYIRILGRIMGAEYISLTSNPEREAANSLYKKLGFKQIGKVGKSNYYRLDLR